MGYTVVPLGPDTWDGFADGLDISRRIVVDNHGGDIAFESRPGETVVRVRLPRQAAT